MVNNISVTVACGVVCDAAVRASRARARAGRANQL